MKKLLGIIVLVLLFYNNSYSAIKGTGEVKMSEEAVNHFIGWVKMKRTDKGRKCKPSMFIMSSNGDWTQGNRCCWQRCQDTYSNQIIQECERATGVLCGVFSIRRVIYWENGINTKKKKAKFSSKMSDSEIREKLEQLGFIGNNIAAKVQKKEQTQTDDSNDIVQQIKDLKELYDSGALTKEEFEKAKKKLLN